MKSKFLTENILNIKNIEQGGFNPEPNIKRFYSLVNELNIDQKNLRNFEDELRDSCLLDYTLLGRNDVLDVIRRRDVSNRIKIFTILLWGVYFKAIPSENTKLSFVEKLLTDPVCFDKVVISLEEQLDIIKSINDNSESNSSIQKLFRSFSYNKENYLPGIGHAYFTKFFHFFSIKKGFLTPLLILDKWSSIAWIFLVNQSLNEFGDITNPIDYFKISTTKGKDGKVKLEVTLQRKKSIAYLQFLNDFDLMARDLSSTLGQKIGSEKIEEFVFGWDKNEKGLDYENPRIIFEMGIIDELL